MLTPLYANFWERILAHRAFGLQHTAEIAILHPLALILQHRNGVVLQLALADQLILHGKVLAENSEGNGDRGEVFQQLLFDTDFDDED